MNKALVTGGAGFIGSHLSNALLLDGWQVYVLDNLSTGFRENIPKRAKFLKIDLSHEDFIKKIPQVKFDAIFHLAAQSSGEISFDDPVYDLKVNCLSTLRLLDWAYKNGAKRFIYASSMSVYGEQDIQPVRESAAVAPKSFYGIGKLASERYIDIYSAMGLETTSLRLFNVYGPNQNLDNLRQGMVSIYMAYILKNKELFVKGSAERFRDFIYITDVIAAILQCLNKRSTFGRCYNVATGIKTTVRELIQQELEGFDCDHRAYPVKYGNPTPGDTFGIYADISSIKKDTGWSPQVLLKDGLIEMINWSRGSVQGNSKR
jgi:UDP-glucose 4-epimerase